ncbi:MAG TPA: thermonuclease family protein [Rectinemataceae bacterium]|nr:thermonuclease family protein [Rectinemataceae bacterium]
MMFMKRQLSLIVVALIAAGLWAKASYPPLIVGKVVGVHDGDTITVLQAERQYKIRLDGIDAPELSQAYGQVSKRFASAFAFGKTARVEVHGVDRYGRYLGEVFVEGRSLNRELVKAGLAWQYLQYSKDPVLAKLEREARTQRIGLWKDASPEAPWDFRKRKK